MLDIHASGVYIIAATPFTEDGAVDGASLDRLMDFYVGCGIGRSRCSASWARRRS